MADRLCVVYFLWAKHMTEEVSKSPDKPTAFDDSVTWHEGANGERITVRVSSLQTNGVFAVVESIAAPGCAVPLHLHRNEEEHLVIVTGRYRFQLEDEVFEQSAGTSVTVPKGAHHSWRNISDQPGRMVVTLTPGGFENCIQTIRNSPVEKLEEVAASFGCYLVGPPVSA